MKRITALLLALVFALALAACGSSSADVPEVTEPVEEEESTTAVAETEQADADTADAGFEEFPIFEDEEVGGLMNVNAVYFQPVPMAPGQENYEDFDLHLECDVSALENTLGYGVGDWIPYLTVDYRVIGSDGSDAATGTFMVMAASDGPHYGANVKLDKADTYDVEFTFHNPAENGYLVHSDATTGPGGLLDDYFGDGNLTLLVEDCWDYTPVDWE